LQNSDLISVIIPTFERPQQTIAAINSVLVQSYKNFEIIVVDDGSSESSFNELSSLIPNKDVQLLQIDHSSHPGIARNFAVKSAKGEWLAFLDSDDRWHPEKLAIQVKLAHESGAKAIATAGVLSSLAEKKVYLSHDAPTKLSKLQLLKRNWIITSSVLLNKELYELVGGMGESLTVRGAEDYSTWLKVASLADWRIIEEPLVVYSDQSPDSIRRSDPQYQNYAIALGWIDYLNWKKTNGDSSHLPVKLALKMAPFIIWAEGR
jgi:glycosyltransferase involved in cell wall biosynthesis